MRVFGWYGPWWSVLGQDSTKVLCVESVCPLLALRARARISQVDIDPLLADCARDPRGVLDVIRRRRLLAALSAI
jgi:hypothetical protein